MDKSRFINAIKGCLIDDVKVNSNRIPAAVMVIIHFKDDEPYVILTKRSKRLKNHASQISFAGGIREQGEDFIDTAIREVYEELGLRIDEDEVLGALKPVDTITSNFCIVPFVSIVDDVDGIKPNKEEIDEVIDANLIDLLSSISRDYRDDAKGEHYKFVYGKHVVWGATARILKQIYDSFYKKDLIRANKKQVYGSKEV